MPEFVTTAQRLRAVMPLAETPIEAPVASETVARGSFALAELPLVRLAAYEAFASAFERLLQQLAQDVLARELAFAPCDLERLMHDALEAFSREEPIAFLVREPMRETIGGIAVRADPSLAPGDLIVQVRDETIDARFAVRLAGAIDAALGDGA